MSKPDEPVAHMVENRHLIESADKQRRGHGVDPGHGGCKL